MASPKAAVALPQQNLSGLSSYHLRILDQVVALCAFLIRSLDDLARNVSLVKVDSGERKILA